MPIVITDHKGLITVDHEGRVVQVRTFAAQRNMSDTLDYTDFRTVDCVEALVYVGRTEKVWDRDVGGHVEKELPPIKRFAWVDCSNHFVWRGSDERLPVVDEGWERDPEMNDDYSSYLFAGALAAEERRVRDEKAAACVAAEKKREEDNRPVVGKRMTVFRGRKVPIGTQGTVAYVHPSGRVLLKEDSRWQDRKADGVWVDGRNLELRK